MTKTEQFNLKIPKILESYESGMSAREIGEVHKCAAVKVRQLLKEMGVWRTEKERREIATKKHQKTCIERYGVSNPNKTKKVRDKIANTCMERYGGKAPACDKNIRAKILSSEGYKTRNVKGNFHRPEVQAKVQKTLNKKKKKRREEFVGIVNSIKNPNTRKVMDKTGLGAAYAGQLINETGLREKCKVKHGYLETVIEDFLDENNIKYQRNNRSIIKSDLGSALELDFYLPEHNVAIEVNDIATHNSSYNPHGRIPKSPSYHLNKTQLCKEKGIRLIHAWEHCLPNTKVKCRFGSWEVLQNCILSACGIYQKRLYARKCEVVTFSANQTKKFFDENNINGYRRSKVTYALIEKGVEKSVDNILMAYAVGDAFLGKGSYQAEIARGACKLGYQIVGGASKLWKEIINTYQVNGVLASSIVYYVDLNYYDGESMKFLDGVSSQKTVQKSFWNYWTQTEELKNREPMRHKEISAGYRDKIIWQVFNAGTQVNVWKRA